MTKKSGNKYDFPAFVFSYLAVPFFLWVLIGQVIQVNLTTEKLIKVTGVVDHKINIWSKSKKSDRELRIYLTGRPDYFRIMAVYNYKRFSNKINTGDTVELFVRPKWMTFFGGGSTNQIFQMTSNGEMIFIVADTKKNAKAIIILSVFVIPLFFFLGRYCRRKRKRSPTS